MGKIFYILGKSSTGKDTIYKNLMENKKLGLRPIIPYTTRPMRAKETPGVEYHFTDEEELMRMEAAGKVIELRTYETVHGIWKYFTAAGNHVDLDHYHYVMIGVLDSFLAVRKYYGENIVIPVYIEVEDGERLQRALDRERSQEQPRYAELCRRFLTDSKDFAEERILQANIERRFLNNNLQDCIQEITAYIQKQMVM
ncbi:guanylate kinase [Candidatus Merdisoma sp. JLR.KK006]|uniref:guanylate kinase n=1 Tax=Candidatus Merdisoma sp. JLR.KK006 TaxID=3112626 RepID=UPI002FEEE1E7